MICPSQGAIRSYQEYSFRRFLTPQYSDKEVDLFSHRGLLSFKLLASLCRRNDRFSFRGATNASISPNGLGSLVDTCSSPHRCISYNHSNNHCCINRNCIGEHRCMNEKRPGDHCCNFKSTCAGGAIHSSLHWATSASTSPGARGKRSPLMG